MMDLLEEQGGGALGPSEIHSQVSEVRCAAVVAASKGGLYVINSTFKTVLYNVVMTVLLPKRNRTKSMARWSGMMRKSRRSRWR